MRPVLLYACLFLITVGLARAPRSEAPTVQRSLWVWDSAEKLLENPEEAQALFDFLEAPHGRPSQAIERIFFEALHYSRKHPPASGKPHELARDYLESEHAPKLRAFLAHATKRGIRVELLDGQTPWALDRVPALEFAKKAIAFNKKGSDQARFSGIHWDIEPHVLGPVWRENNSQGKDRYNDVIQAQMLNLARETRQAILESGLSMTQAWDLGTDYAHYVTDLMPELGRKGGPLDYIVLMNYFDDEERFVHGAQGAGGMEENLRMLEVPTVYGVETIMEPWASDGLSFWQEGIGTMENMLARLEKRYGGHPRFAGWAIHHWDSYRRMKP